MAAGSTNPDMTTAFHTRPYGRSMEIKSNLGINEFHTANQSSNVFGGSFSKRDSVGNLGEKGNFSILKDDFSSRPSPFILTSIAPMSLDRSNQAI